MNPNKRAVNWELQASAAVGSLQRNLQQRDRPLNAPFKTNNKQTKCCHRLQTRQDETRPETEKKRISAEKLRGMELQFVLREQTVFFSRRLKMDGQMLTALCSFEKKAVGSATRATD